MKDVQAGVVYLVAAAVIGWLWLSGAGAKGIAALQSGLQGRPTEALANYSFRRGGTA
jgi:hypothetical protein